jgi:hypothetical protein
MSEQNFPPAFGILQIGSNEDGTPDAWWNAIANDGEFADELADECGTPDAPAHVVELIARDDAERMVRDAVAAERAKWAGAKDVMQQILMEEKT